MQKKLLILAVVALVLIGGAVFVWQKKGGFINWSKTGDVPIVQVEKVLNEKEKTQKYAWNWDGDTNNWKVYINDDFSFMLRYPEEVFNLRIMPVSDSVGVYSEPLPLKEFRLTLTQKGYSEDDYSHQIWMNLNSLKSDKEYYSETQNDTATVSVSFGSKSGKMYGTKENISKINDDHTMFLKDGKCNPETFTVVFDDIKNPNGDVRSYIHVGCEGDDGNYMGKIYRAVYQSIKFIKT